MQEEVESRTFNLAISTTKLTARVLWIGFKKGRSFVRRKKLNKEMGNPDKKSVKQLMAENKHLTNIEISQTDIAGFEKYARKYRIDYQIKLDDSIEPPKYLVFFKARDSKVMSKAFKEFLSSTLQKDEKKSVLQELRKMQKAVESIPRKIKNKDKEHSL